MTLLNMMLQATTNLGAFAAPLGAAIAVIETCDLATTQIPAEGHILPINAITSLIGAPFVIWVILKRIRVS